uniref:Uncharacterized protein n=1 Tax=Ditylenchus dipsaci TaxID=166011 RepID=A0A915CRQ8_9BILA
MGDEYLRDQSQNIEYPFEETTGMDENRIRGNWASKTDYLLSVFGFTFALGNLWRFPYQLATHGVLFMELCLGQFISLGPVSVWKVSPLFKGIGISMVFISCLLAIYYNMITAYALFYVVNSLKVICYTLGSCGNDWNTENCSLWNKGAVETCRLLNGYVLANGTCMSAAGENLIKYENISISNSPTDLVPTISPASRVMPSVEYFHNQVLMISTGIGEGFFDQTFQKM